MFTKFLKIASTYKNVPYKKHFFEFVPPSIMKYVRVTRYKCTVIHEQLLEQKNLLSMLIL